MQSEQTVNILLVDDRPENLLALEAILGKPGWNIVKVRSGEDALRALLKQDFALILLDVHMPGMNGFETAALIRKQEKTKNLPIIFLTASNMDDPHLIRGYNIGGFDYISKPFIPELLKSKVAIFVDLFNKTEEVRRQAELVCEFERREHERERAETLAALHASEERFRATFESAAIGMALMDLNGRVIESNSAMQNMLGYGWEELRGMFFAQIIHPDDLTPDRSLYSDLAKGHRENYQMENRYLRKDGRLVWGSLTVSLVRDSNGEPEFAISMIENISERKQTEAELQTRVIQQAVVAELGQRALSNIGLYELMNTVAWTVANTLQVEYTKVLELHPDQNAFILRAGVGWKEGYIGRVMLRAGLDSQLGYTLLLLSNEPVIIEDLTTETRFWSPSLLKKHNVKSGLSVTIGGRNQPFGVLGAYTVNQRTFTKDDINFLQSVANVLAAAIEQKRAEQERAKLLTREHEARMDAEKANRIKDEFLAMISHELRTPVTGILGWAELLLDGELDNENISFALESIVRNANLQVQLIEDLLDISRIITGKLRLDIRSIEVVPIVEIAIGALVPSLEAKKIRVIRKFEQHPGVINGDPDRLQQVVINLLSNAIKFTPEDGQIEVRTEIAGSNIRIIVSDTGRGISHDFLPFVFDRFRQADSTSTREHGGMGLGLAIVHHLVEMHKGSVRALSEGTGKGATFIVELPLAEAQVSGAHHQIPNLASIKQAGAGAEIMTLSGIRVLIVDDEIDTRELLLFIMKRYGAEAIAVSSTAEALEEFDRRLPHVLIADIGMPIEDGYTLINKVRARSEARGGQVPAVALTAYARDEDRRRALSAGYQMHIAKPIEPSRLAEVVAMLVRGPAMNEEEGRDSGSGSYRIVGQK
jgi:PAS domain S-box-containing protein